MDKLTTYVDAEAQLIALDLFIHVIDDLNGEVALHYVNLLRDTFVKHRNMQCRTNYYQLLMKLYEKPELKKEDALRTALLQGFADSSDIIRKEVLAFWSDPKRLSVDVIKRTQQVLKTIYSPEVESHWVQTATELLLHLTPESPDYDLVLFESLSEDTELFEYQIDHAWSNRSLPMTPLFSTQTQMDMDMEFPSATPGTLAPSSPNKRATSPSRAPRPVQFTPTITTAAADVIMGDSQETDADGFQVPSRVPHFAASLSSHHGDSQGSIRIPKRFAAASIHPSQTSNVFVKRALRKNAKKEQYLRMARERRQH